MFKSKQVKRIRMTLAIGKLAPMLLLVALFGCNEEKIVITGSSTVAPLTAEIAKRFEQTHPTIRIDVQTGGSSRGLSDARGGLADIGMVSRGIKAEDGVVEHLIGRDGICMIVHTDNPIQELSPEQIVDIYSGRVKNWEEVGGDDRELVVVNKAAGRSTLELFAKHFALTEREMKADIIIGDNQHGIKTVIGNASAIGYVSIGAAQFEVENGSPLKLLPLEGVQPTIENVQNGSYPLSRPLNLVTQAEPTGVVQDFIEFAASHEVDDLREEQYFVSP